MQSPRLHAERNVILSAANDLYSERENREHIARHWGFITKQGEKINGYIRINDRYYRTGRVDSAEPMGVALVRRAHVHERKLFAWSAADRQSASGTRSGNATP